MPKHCPEDCEWITEQDEPRGEYWGSACSECIAICPYDFEPDDCPYSDEEDDGLECGDTENVVG